MKHFGISPNQEDDYKDTGPSSRFEYWSIGILNLFRISACPGAKSIVWVDGFIVRQVSDPQSASLVARSGPGISGFEFGCGQRHASR